MRDILSRDRFQPVFWLGDVQRPERHLPNLSLANRLLKEEARPVGGLFKVLLLSAPDSQDTLLLENPISNDKRSKSGKPTAFTMGQRYVSSEALKLAKTTSDLD